MRIPRFPLEPFFMALVGLLAVAVPGCGGEVRSQWLFVVSTDAYLPSWGDRILVELLGDEGALACGGCRREFAVSPENVPLSFGLAPPPRAVRVRARLFRQSQTGADGLPAGRDLIDFVGILPPEAPAGVERLVVPLSGFCFGKPADIKARTSCTYTRDGTGFKVLPERELVDLDIDRANLRPGRVDRLRGSACPTPSSGAVPEDMACFSGGTFLMGASDSLGADTDYPTSPLFLASYFYPILVDKDETTVGAVRELLRRRALSLGTSSLLRKGPGVPASCTYLSDSDSTNDALPLNCISRSGASSVCIELGKELLTEIDWEYVATAGGRATSYPWGEEPPTCERSVLSSSPSCLRAGPAPGGASGDVTPQGIRNLGGNLSEWVATLFVPYTDPCWTEYSRDGSEAGGLADPDSCYVDTRLVGWRGPWAHRGGSFARLGSSARSSSRFASADGAPRPEIGFRCKKQLLQ